MTDGIRRVGFARSVLLSLLFVASLLLPLAGPHLGWTSGRGATEKRKLAQRPVLKASLAGLRNYPRRFESYFADHFGFRPALITLHHLLRVQGLRVSSSEHILVGKKGWYYYVGREIRSENPLADYAGTHPLGLEAIERWKNVLQERHEWLAARGIRYLFVIVPNKLRIYPEHMPGGIPQAAGESPLEQLVRALRQDTDVAVLDLTGPLMAAKPIFRLYHLTDPHWNHCGGFIGYQAVVGRLAEWLPGMEPYSLDDTSVITGALEDRAAAQLLNMESFIKEDALFLKAERRLRAVHAPQPGMKWAHTGWTGDTNLPRAVVIGDSSLGPLAPYFSEHFERVLYRLTYSIFPEEMILKEKPDVVVEVTIERFLRDEIENPTEVVDAVRALQNSAE